MIIQNSEVFSQDYLPLDIFHRENEIKGIKHFINSFYRGVKNHIYIYGLQGTGKTAVSRYLSSKLNAEGRNSIYLDSKQISSKSTFLYEVARAMGVVLPSRGISLDEFFLRVNNRGVKAVIFLDEVDSFKDKSILYKLSKSEDFNIMFVFVSNLILSDFISKFSSFVSTQEFERYSPSQLKDIIKERARLGLVPGSYNEDIISKIAGFSAKHKGNARAGIMLLFHSAVFAEEDGRNYITLKDVENAKSSLFKELIHYDFSSFSLEKQLILKSLFNSQYKTLSEIVTLFPNKGERMVRNYLKELVEQGYVVEETLKLADSFKRVYRIKLRV